MANTPPKINKYDTPNKNGTRCKKCPKAELSDF